MKITKVTAKNFRTLQDIEINFGESYCTISGKNNVGKSAIIQLLSNALRQEYRPWHSDNQNIEYDEDKTQWVTDAQEIIIGYEFKLYKNDDPALISFINRFSNNDKDIGDSVLGIRYVVKKNSQQDIKAVYNGKELESSTSKTIINRIRQSNLLITHNSTSPHEEFFYGPGRKRSFIEAIISEGDKKELSSAEKALKSKFKKFAKQHKDELDGLLCKLRDKYDVQFTPIESGSARRVPLGINLTDKTVDVPLSAWGAGTQNRTYILMAILQANRVRLKEKPEDRITPIILIEEPESFLHPSAQSEFGQLLRVLASELGIQLIATTHSPYMLNQENPENNILLKRETRRGKFAGTKVEPTKGEHWMAPFSEHLGLSCKEFENWKPFLGSSKSKMLLVEGSIDKEYFEHITKYRMTNETLMEGVEITPYGGKDAIKNILLMKFMLSKFDNVFITFDLDASNDVERSIMSLGLRKDIDYAVIGHNSPGRNAIEGLLPSRIYSNVMQDNQDIFIAATSSDTHERKRAKDTIKKLLLSEFKKHTDYTPEEMKGFNAIIKLINKKMTV